MRVQHHFPVCATVTGRSICVGNSNRDLYWGINGSGDVIKSGKGQSVNKYLPEIGLAVGKAAGGKRIWNKEGFLAWRCGASAGAVDETPVEEDEIDEIADELIAINDIPEIEVILDDSCFDPENAPHICDNPYHHIPVIPSTGTMTFMNNRADDILGTIKSILCDTRVNVTISWEFVSGE